MDPQHCYQDTEKARDESVYYALMFGLLGLGSTVATFLQGLMFGISGKNLLFGIFYKMHLQGTVPVRFFYDTQLSEMPWKIQYGTL
jgi:hypothetical protein